MMLGKREASKELAARVDIGQIEIQGTKGRLLFLSFLLLVLIVATTPTSLVRLLSTAESLIRGHFNTNKPHSSSIDDK